MKTTKYVVPAMVAILVAALAGCASLGKGPSDKEKIAKLLDDWKAGIESSNLDALMMTYSEDFKGEQGGKAELHDFMKRVIDSGYLKDAKVDMGSMKTTREKDTVTASPIFLSSSRGAITVELTLKKEKDKEWRIVASQAG